MADEQRPSPADVAEAFAKMFQGQANGLALLFGGPLYLVGSMLTSSEPGDIDLRLAIAREDLEALFGEGPDNGGSEWTPAQLRRSREELKQSRRLTRRWVGNEKRKAAWAPRFDFQFQVHLFSEDTGEPIVDDRPRLRLDRVPNDYFRAGRGSP